MIVTIILLCFVIVLLGICYFNSRKKFNNKISFLEKKVADFKSISTNYDKEILSINSKLSNSENCISELKSIIENNKFKMVEMLKNLLAVQKTLTPDRGFIKSLFPDYFVIDIPYDIAGGDFYKFAAQGDNILVACGNCGVSGINGLIKGILNVVFLSEIINRSNLNNISSGKILDLLRSKYAHLADNNEVYRRDENIPVNFTICIINQKDRILSYSGAYGSMCLIRKSYPGTNRKEVDVHEFRGDKMNFAVSFGRRKNYATETIELEKDDKIYLKTDGFSNQRGGRNGNRFGDAYLRQMFMKHANEPMLEQMQSYKNEYDKWCCKESRANDVLIIGLALKIKHIDKHVDNFNDNFNSEFE